MNKKLEVYKNFFDIHEEVVSKKKAIQKLEVEAQRASNLIDQKEPIIDSLRQEVNELKEQNNEYHEILSECNLEAKHYEEQTCQLFQLIEVLNDKIEKYYPSEDEKDYDLPDDVNIRLNEKLDKIIQMVSFEYTQIRKDKIIKEVKQLHEANKILRNEINKLNVIPKNWIPDDEFSNTAIEECEMRYVPNDNPEFQSLNSIPIIIAETTPNLMEDCCMPRPMPLNDIEPLRQKVDDFVQSQIDQNHLINSSYELQAEYFKAIRDELNSKSLSENDLQKLQFQYQNQVHQMNEFTEITPIKIPEINISNNNDQPIQIYTEKFLQFCRQIEGDHPYNSISEDFINSAENSLSIPPFEEPPSVPFVTKPILSPDLVHLADSLKELIKSAEKVESLRQIQEKVSSQHKLFLENATKDEIQNNESHKSEDINISQIYLPRPLSPPPENLTTIEFRELVKSKLPDMFHSIFEIPDSNILIESSPLQDESDLVNQPEESNVSESINSFQINDNGSSISMNAEERTRAFQDILKDFASFELPPVPNIIPPTPAELRVKTVDFQPMKEEVENMLDTSEEDVTFLLDEIMQLEKKAEELSIHLKNELSGNDSNTKFTINDIENDIKKLEMEKDLADKRKAPSLKSAREIKGQLEQTDNEIKELKARLLEVTITDEMLKEKNEELSAKEAEILDQYNAKLRLI